MKDCKSIRILFVHYRFFLNPINAELNPICHLLALLEVHHILYVGSLRVKLIKVLMNVLFVVLEALLKPWLFTIKKIFGSCYW